ncbi:hypothetical protein BAUCODRAFT_37235 [Baudoinia panamericana UAMH 10762]|uniref:Uncharacterized protein n=1 Tax=Baudoinia panamericana (strain UAMH 10762) TaxID=717646 RepID=M2LHD0_BAUPA|nr:uncharacterized protein BAUCODRAFT_37235 [Baudoinia panamericana UAMH 10762]EMC93547.1 hypothetical protein BAUCODRAFT_37235 [Baudoinia panamericana UAMH 10762]
MAAGMTRDSHQLHGNLGGSISGLVTSAGQQHWRQVRTRLTVSCAHGVPARVRNGHHIMGSVLSVLVAWSCIV